MRVAWQIFKDRKRSAHLVVAALSTEQPFGGRDVRRTLHLLERLIKRQGPIEDYATAIVRDASYPGLYSLSNARRVRESWLAAWGPDRPPAPPNGQPGGPSGWQTHRLTRSLSRFPPRSSAVRRTPRPSQARRPLSAARGTEPAKRMSEDRGGPARRLSRHPLPYGPIRLP
jgi:hypothetical protein